MKRLFAIVALACATIAHAQAPAPGPPAITQLGWSDPIYPNAVLFLQGTNFTGTTQVRIGAATDVAFMIDSDTNIRAFVPPDAIPGGAVSVVTGLGLATYGVPITVVKYIPGPGPVCLPNTGNTNTLFNTSTGNTVVSLWCDVPSGTYHYGVSGSATAASFMNASCLAGVPPFTISLNWIQKAWAACIYGVLTPSDQAYADRLAYAWVPRPTVKGSGPQTIFTTAKNGGLGSPLILGNPQVFQTIPGGTTVGGQRLPGGNVTRYCDVSGATSIQGSPIPAGSYAACTLVFPPLGGFKYPPSADKAVIKGPTDAVLVDAGHHIWGIDTKGLITVDGIEDSTSFAVTELAFVGGLIWQQNVHSFWWSKTDPTASWLPVGGTPTAPL